MFLRYGFLLGTVTCFIHLVFLVKLVLFDDLLRHLLFNPNTFRCPPLTLRHINMYHRLIITNILICKHSRSCFILDHAIKYSLPRFILIIGIANFSLSIVVGRLEFLDLDGAGVFKGVEGLICC